MADDVRKHNIFDSKNRRVDVRKFNILAKRKFNFFIVQKPLLQILRLLGLLETMLE